MSWFTRGWGFGGGRGGAANSPPSQPEQHQVHPASQSPVPRTVDPRQLFSARSPQPLNLQNYPGNGIQPAVNQFPPSPVRPSATHHPIGLPRSLPQHNAMVQAPYHMTQPSLPCTPVHQPTTFSPPQRQPNMYQSQPLFTSSPHQHNDLLQNMHQYDQNLTDSGPKQSRKPTTSTETNSDSNKPAIPKYDPRVLLDRRGAGAKAVENGDDDLRSEATRKEQVNPAESEDSAPGQGNLIARQYGLSNRDTTLQHTKRKSQAQDGDEGPDRKKTKAVVDNRNSSGQLGQHLKKEREHYAAERGPSGTVDLTADDEGGDDELVVTAVSKVQSKAWENEIVCLGALSGNAHMSRLPMVSPKMQAAVGKEYWPLLRVDLKRDFGALHQKVEVMDKQKNSCGMLEPKLGRAIARLLDGKGLNNVDVTAYMPSRKRESGEYAGQPISALLKIGIVLYSPRGKADLIGKYLSQEQLFLSQPNHLGMSHGKEYYNPHVPKSYAPAGGSGPRQPQTGRSTTYSMRTVEEVQQQTMSMFDNLTKHEDLPRMEPQSGLIKTELLDHQKQALHFLTDHERDDSQTFSLWKPHVDQKGLAKWEHVITGEELRSEPDPIRGGILADMMGLGKTLSILSLIAETKETAKTFFKQPSIDRGKINAIGTLIICPKSVLSNWEEQLATHIKNDKLRCYTYHGSNRLTDSAELAKFNIVLTTYNTAAAEFATKGKPLAALCWFRIVLDEAHTIRTQNTQVFKAAIELSAERRWAVTGTPVQNRLEDLQALIRFLRIKPFHDPHVWTQYLGAPLKNGNPQAFNQLRLLVDSITLRRGKDKIGLTGKVETIVRLEFSTEDRRIYADMSEKQGTKLQRLTGGFNRRLKGKAYAHILKAIGMLRMFCAHGLDMLSEDDRKEVLHGLNSDNAIAIDLGDEPEFTDYNNFTTDKYAFDYLQNETDTDGNDCIICARKVGIEKSEGDEDDDRGLESSDDEGDHIIGYLTPCFHLLCAGCKPRYEEMTTKTMTADRRCRCPQCEMHITYGLYPYSSSKYDEYLDAKANRGKKERRVWTEENYKGPSAKVQALLQELEESRRETASLPEGEPPIRSVVFSGWTAYLDLIEVALDEQSINFVRLDGSMSVKQRSAVLRQFATDPDITVILVSIKAGGQGLNFTAANKVYMMEPQYNPGVEHQAIDRVHRLGQQREVVIKHFIMKDSVEEGILGLQEKKVRLAQRTLERGGGKKSKDQRDEERIEELRRLFGGK